MSNWYQLSITDVLEQLDSDIRHGLTEVRQPGIVPGFEYTGLLGIGSGKIYPAAP